MLRRLNRFWNILREVDLEAIRRGAEVSVPLMVVAERADDRAAVTRLLNGEDAVANPWLHSCPADQLDASLAVNPARLAIVVSRGGDLPGSFDAARKLLIARHIPVLSVMVGSSRLLSAFARSGEKKRVALPSIDDDQRQALAQALFDMVPGDTRLALARQFPGLREPVFSQLIAETARTNASYSFTTGLAETVPLLAVPLNVGDVIILTKNQLVMAYRIALASGKRGRPRELVGEMIGVLGGGLIARQVARELIGLIPVAGIVPKVAVAYTGTWAIGHGIAAWATGRTDLAGQSLDQLYRAGLNRGRIAARGFARRRGRVA